MQKAESRLKVNLRFCVLLLHFAFSLLPFLRLPKMTEEEARQQVIDVSARVRGTISRRYSAFSLRLPI
jgi:hypothetical protein